MKKTFIAVLALAGLVLTACNPGGETPDPVGTTYPRMQLIEHFTGMDCGYCPQGMDQLYAVYGQNPGQFVWVSNHTYYTDELTVQDSKTLAKRLGASGAPEFTLNRVKHDGERTYHTYYLAEYAPSEATTATSVVYLDRTYDPATRSLKITAYGKTSETDMDSVRLTVLITESGIIGRQEDYYGTWEGWTKFRHTHAVRVFASSAMGDIVGLKNRTFSREYTLTLSDKWNADNCEIAAWITPGTLSWPVLNAAKRPVVEGTEGGENIVHGGIEEVPVSSTYPEQGAPNAEAVMNKCNAYYAPAQSATVMSLAVFNTDSAVATLSNTGMYAFAQLYLLLEPGSTTVPVGTYNFRDELTAGIGDALAGYRDDAEHSLAGSLYVWVYKSGSSLYLARQWMLAEGSVVVTDSGLEINGTTMNGSPVHATYSGPITPKSASGAPDLLRSPKRL